MIAMGEYNRTVAKTGGATHSKEFKMEETMHGNSPQILSKLHQQARGIFRRGDFDKRDKELVRTWLEKFAKMCEKESEDASD